jgi:exodeoxyribonuclease VII large subunit
MALPATDLFGSQKPVETIAQLTVRIKRLLEDRIRYVVVKGEISGWKPHPSGHFYFSLKDADAILPCALFRLDAQRLKFRPADGMQVIASGTIEVYVKQGRYQLVVQRMEPEGLGALMLQFEQLKERLAKEGLFDEARKRAIPRFPATIAIVTSPVGAALQDMLRVITSRWPKVRILLYPVRVQGEGAAQEIAAAIGHLNLARPDVDVLIVGRGGGSIEDLWAFNEEIVARAIHGSRIPVVSAVGHETDFTIADFVADLRAATPTDAAAKVTPVLADVEARLTELKAKLDSGLRNRLNIASQHVDDLSGRLDSSLRTKAQHDRLVLERARARLRSPSELAKRRRDDLAHLERRATLALERLRDASRQKAEAAKAHLEAVSPLAVLQRGYSVTLDEKGRVVTDPAQVKPGDRLETRVSKGRLKSKVE